MKTTKDLSKQRLINELQEKINTLKMDNSEMQISYKAKIEISENYGLKENRLKKFTDKKVLELARRYKEISKAENALKYEKDHIKDLLKQELCIRDIDSLLLEDCKISITPVSKEILDTDKIKENYPAIWKRNLKTTSYTQLLVK